MLKKSILFLIKIYQLLISPDQGIFRKQHPVCRFYPTCSQYTYEAVQKYGAFEGLIVGLKRILRCHSWNTGGYEPIE